MTGARLDLRASSAFVMTPQLQQAIKLLQMSNQDLCSFVAGELETNPFLEGEGCSAFSSAGGAQASSLSQEGGKETAAAVPEEDDGVLRGADVYGRERFSEASQGGGSSSASRDWTETIAEAPSLREHLLGQIHVDFPDPAERLVAAALVECLDEAGYLPAELELVRAQLGLDAALFESIVSRLQQLDPSGIFARSLKECLSIQLREKNRLDPAMATLLEHLDLLAKRDRATLMRLCGVDDEDLTEMVAEIRALAPKPAQTFSSDVAPSIVADVFLLPDPSGGWRVELNNDTLPRVLANETFYEKVVEGGALRREDKAYLSERWQQANWLVKALRQRAETILKVATEIVRRQDRFFVYGVQHLKPLILRDIAEAISMHESTVSRVTQNKYMATPRGVFELKYFFSGALPATGGGEGVSTLAVRERIRELIAAEDAQDILSDDRLTVLLKGEGIAVARRTVAKYRESLCIPTSAQRKREKRGAF